MRFLAAAATTLLLVVPALAETNVGVTAAVNQDASGNAAGNVRTISLGDNIIYSERIQTGAEGLVQILLADGTTFMVGPNSDLVIDSFVYDPNAGTAQVTASFTKGVLRFIGGQTSKTEGGVTINTPVGTMGIRGAMVDVVLDPPPGTPQHIDMLFGNEVTLEQGQQLLGRLYAAGYSLVMGQNGLFEPMKTPPGFGSQIQQALAGKLGTKGGAPKGPNDDDVNKSEVAKNNKPSDGPDLTQAELDALLYAAAQYDQLRNFILNNQTPQGFTGGVLVGDDTHAPITNSFGIEFDDSYNVIGYDPVLAQFGFDADGNPLAIAATYLGTLADCEGTDCEVSIVYEGDGTDGRIVLNYPGEDPLTILTTDNKLFSHDQTGPENPMNGLAGDEGDPEMTLAETLNCASCSDFIKWGFWGFSVGEFEFEGVSGEQVDFLSTYISGDLTTRAQLDNLADQSESGSTIATYYGDAVGVVHNEGMVPGEKDYVATGNMQMDWSFGNRAGTVSITEFDPNNANLNLEYGVTSPAGAAGFVGFLDDESYDTSGTAQGAFVNNGSNVAAGVIGSWDYTEYFYDNPFYTVGGIFMGVPGTN